MNSDKNNNLFNDGNGNIYKGSFKNDKKNGNGILLTKNNIIFNGTFKDDNIVLGEKIYYTKTEQVYKELYKELNNNNSKQMKILDTKIEAEFHGEFINNEMSTGILKYGSASKYSNTEYKGSFENNKKTGKGILEFPNHHKYIGYFKNDKMNGEGEYIFNTNNNKNQIIYKGIFDNDKMNGFGILCYKNCNKDFLQLQNNSIFYEGYFKNNKKHGDGIYYYYNNIYKVKYDNDILILNT